VKKNELMTFIRNYKLPNRDKQMALYLNEIPHTKFIHISKDWTEHDDISLLDCVVGVPDGSLAGKNIYDFAGNGYRGENLGMILLENLIDIKEPKLKYLVSDIFIGQPSVAEFSETDYELLGDIIVNFFDFVKRTTGKIEPEKAPALNYIQDIAKKLNIIEYVNKRLKGTVKKTSEIEHMIRTSVKPIKAVTKPPAVVQKAVSTMEKALDMPVKSAEPEEIQLDIPDYLKKENFTIADYMRFIAETFSPLGIQICDSDALEQKTLGNGVTPNPGGGQTSAYYMFTQVLNYFNRYKTETSKGIEHLVCDVDEENGTVIFSFNEKDSKNKNYILLSKNNFVVCINPRKKLGGMKHAAQILASMGGKLYGGTPESTRQIKMPAVEQAVSTAPEAKPASGRLNIRDLMKQEMQALRGSGVAGPQKPAQQLVFSKNSGIPASLPKPAPAPSASPAYTSKPAPTPASEQKPAKPDLKKELIEAMKKLAEEKK